MEPQELHDIIKARKTEKVLGDVLAPTIVSSAIRERNDPLVREAVITAGMAPFHYPRTKEIAEPWRAYHLWCDDTSSLATYLADNLGVKTKEPQLLAASSALVLITWLPQHPLPQTEKERVIEEEHIAATSAMTQNLLLLLTAHGIGNYWSSGGILRSAKLFQYLGISTEERLLGAIFIEYPEVVNSTHERKPGNLRNQRSLKWISELNNSDWG